MISPAIEMALDALKVDGPLEPNLFEKIDAIRAAIEKGQERPKDGDWWCPECKMGLDGSHVTHQERCDTCGTPVTVSGAGLEAQRDAAEAKLALEQKCSAGQQDRADLAEARLAEVTRERDQFAAINIELNDGCVALEKERDAACKLADDNAQLVRAATDERDAERANREESDLDIAEVEGLRLAAVARAEEAERDYAKCQFKWEGTVRALGGAIQDRMAATALVTTLCKCLESIILNDGTTYDHHQPRRSDGKLPSEDGGTIWFTPAKIARAALDKAEESIPTSTAAQGAEQGKYPATPDHIQIVHATAAQVDAFNLSPGYWVLYFVDPTTGATAQTLARLINYPGVRPAPTSAPDQGSIDRWAEFGAPPQLIAEAKSNLLDVQAPPAPVEETVGEANAVSGWCPNTSLRIPKGECGCCPDPDAPAPPPPPPTPPMKMPAWFGAALARAQTLDFRAHCDACKQCQKGPEHLCDIGKQWFPNGVPPVQLPESKKAEPALTDKCSNCGSESGSHEAGTGACPTYDSKGRASINREGLTWRASKRKG